MAKDEKDDMADALARMSGGEGHADDQSEEGEAPHEAPTPAPAAPRVRSAAPVINRPAVRPPPPAVPATPAPPEALGRPAGPQRPAPAATPAARPTPVPYAARNIAPTKPALVGGVAFKRTLIPICLTLGTLFVLTGILFFAQDARSALRALPVYLPVSVMVFGLLLLVVAGLNMALVRAQSKGPA